MVCFNCSLKKSNTIKYRAFDIQFCLFRNCSYLLAHLVMSLCNHALSVMWCCHCLRHRRRLCTALPVTALIIETSYLAIYAVISPICAHEILGQCDIYFLNDSHFRKFLYVALLSTWLNLEPSYLAQLCTYTWATCKGEIMPLLIIFLKL